MKRLHKEDKKLLREILQTPCNVLLKEIKKQDNKDKEELIAEIDTFKAIYKKNKDIKVKEIIIKLIKELEETNNRIERIKKVI